MTSFQSNVPACWRWTQFLRWPVRLLQRSHWSVQSTPTGGRNEVFPDGWGLLRAQAESDWTLWESPSYETEFGWLFGCKNTFVQLFRAACGTQNCCVLLQLVMQQRNSDPDHLVEGGAAEIDGPKSVWSERHEAAAAVTANKVSRVGEVVFKCRFRLTDTGALSTDPPPHMHLRLFFSTPLNINGWRHLQSEAGSYTRTILFGTSAWGNISPSFFYTHKRHGNRVPC